jgi:hypothetical protein
MACRAYRPPPPKSFGELAPIRHTQPSQARTTRATANPNAQSIDREATPINNNIRISGQAKSCRHPVGTEHFSCQTRRSISDEKPLKNKDQPQFTISLDPHKLIANMGKLVGLTCTKSQTRSNTKPATTANRSAPRGPFYNHKNTDSALPRGNR